MNKNKANSKELTQNEIMEIDRYIEEAIERIKANFTDKTIDNTKPHMYTSKLGYVVFKNFLNDEDNKELIDLALQDLINIKHDKKLSFVIPEDTFKDEREIEEILSSAEKIRKFFKTNNDEKKEQVLLYNLAAIAQNLKTVDMFYPEYCYEQTDDKSPIFYVSRDEYGRKIKFLKHRADFLLHVQYFVILYPNIDMYMNNADRKGKFINSSNIKADILDMNNFLEKKLADFRRPETQLLLNFEKFNFKLIKHYLSMIECVMAVAYMRAKENPSKNIDVIYQTVVNYASLDRDKQIKHNLIIEYIYNKYTEKITQCLQTQESNAKINCCKIFKKGEAYSFGNKKDTIFILANSGDPFMHICGEGIKKYVKKELKQETAKQNHNFFSTEPILIKTNVLEKIGGRDDNGLETKGYFYDPEIDKHIKIDPNNIILQTETGYGKQENEIETQNQCGLKYDIYGEDPKGLKKNITPDEYIGNLCNRALNFFYPELKKINQKNKDQITDLNKSKDKKIER